MKGDRKEAHLRKLRKLAMILLAKEDMERAPREDCVNPFSEKKIRKKCPESIKDLTSDVGSNDPDLGAE